MKQVRLSVLAGVVIASILMVTHASVVPAENMQVNINSASAAELAQMKGIGTVKARAIVAYREQNGPFTSVDDLKGVKGIGDRLIAKLRSQVSVGQPAVRHRAGASAAAKR